MAKSSKKTRGLYRQNHYKYNSEYVDFDYIKDLTDEEAEWLSNFADNYYSGRFKKDDSKNPIPRKERKRAYKEAGARRRDTMSARYLSRVTLSDEEREGMEVTDLGIVVECRTGKKQ